MAEGPLRRLMKRFLLMAVASLFAFSAQAEEGRVVVSIKPLHSLVAAVMQGDGSEPLLLVDGSASLHSFTLKPSQRQVLEQADLVFYIGDDFELFLGKVFESLPAKVRRVPMSKTPTLTLYSIRGEDDHQHASGYDLHLWLSPRNVNLMVMEIARRLSMAYPERRALYFENARQFTQRLTLLDQHLEQRLALVRNKPFIVFHDAYQYFEKQYMLTSLGALTPHPERAPSAKHLSEMREQVKAAKATCVFSEPQFDSRIVENLLEGTGARSGVLDPEGALLKPGPDLYFQLMEGLAEGLEKCLNPAA